jgi:hypothetical protein
MDWITLRTVKTYLQFVETEDWLAMAEGRASLRDTAKATEEMG